MSTANGSAPETTEAPRSSPRRSAASVAGGAYAEYIAVDADNAAGKPANLTHAEAASLALVGQTAMQALDAAQVQDGQTLLVHGIGGAIGTIIAQLLKERDIRLVGAASAKDRSGATVPCSLSVGMV